jgi:hypothetical protein
MNRQLITMFYFVCALVMLTGVPAQTETLKTRIGELSFTHDFANGYPTDTTVSKLFDEIDFQRACQAYIWSIPIVSMAQWQYAHTKQLGAVKPHPQPLSYINKNLQNSITFVKSLVA